MKNKKKKIAKSSYINLYIVGINVENKYTAEILT